jgi:hypothetical protein
MKRQFAIASAGRTASTSLYQTLINTLSVKNSVCPIWDFSPANLLAQAYAGDRHDFVIVKGETFHFLHSLRFPERTTLVLLTRRDRFRQIVSHLVSLRSGRFHASGPGSAAAAPFRVERHEFLFAAHLILMMAAHLAANSFAEFEQVERWTFEEMTADFSGHLRRLGLVEPRIAHLRGVPYDDRTILNLDEVRAWAEDLGIPPSRGQAAA